MKKILFFISLIILSIHFLNAQTYCALVSLDNDRQAYIDLKGNITYLQKLDKFDEHIFTFKCGLGRMRNNLLYYFINSSGKILSPPLFDKAEDFNEGLAEVRINGKWGFINTDFEIVIKPQFFDSHKFSCGLSVISQNGKHGYMNTNGVNVIKPQFDRVSHFVNNKAWVLTNGKWGCINKAGNYIITPFYADTKDFNEGYSWVKKDQLWGLIDSTGNYLIKPDERNPLIYAHNATFKNFADFHNGLMICNVNKKTGYCNKTLIKVIPAKFDKAFDFDNGQACVKFEGKWGIIDTTGAFIIQPKFADIKLGSNQLYPAKNEEELWGYINENSEWIIKPQFTKAYRFELTIN